MQPQRRGAAMLSALSVLALTLAGCHGSGGSTGGGPAALNATDAVASVNNQNISQAQFFTEMQNYAVNPQSPTASLPVGRAVLQQMISNMGYIGLAQEQGVAPTDAEVNTQYENFKLVQDWSNVRPLEERLKDSGLTVDDLKSLQIRPQLAQVKLLNKGMPAPTEAQAKAFYEQHKTDPFTKPARAHVRAIVLANQSDAQQISQQIKGGQPFDTFLSRSLNRQLVNGDLPQWVPTEGNASQNPALAPLIKAVQTTPVGQTTAPLAFQGGWWLIQIVDKKPKEVMTYDQVKSLIPYLIMEQAVSPQPTDTPQVQMQKGQKRQEVEQQLRDYLAKLANGNSIKVNLPGVQYTQMLNDLKNPPPSAPSMMPSGPAPTPGPPPSGAAPAAPKAAPKAGGR